MIHLMIKRFGRDGNLSNVSVVAKGRVEYMGINKHEFHAFSTLASNMV